MLFIPTPQTSLREILAYYIKTISINKKSYSTEIYRIKALTDILGDVPFGEITPMHVVAFRDKRLATKHPRNPEKTLATSTVKLELMLLSHVFSTAIAEWGMEGLANPVLKIRKPKAPPGRTRRLNSMEESKLVRAAARHHNAHFYAIIVIALETAMRQGEILGLLWENIDWNKHTAHLPTTKNGDPRDVPLSRKAYGILHDYLPRKTTGRVFDSYTTHGLKSSWRVFIKGIEIFDFHFHDLRHCAISSLLERGLNAIEVASISGHKSMSMLKRYAHLSSWLLVAKLDPKPRTKKFRPVLRDQLPDYPAIMTRYQHRIDVDFPDFVDLRLSGSDETTVIQIAKASLLRTVIGLLCDGLVPPVPSAANVVGIKCAKSQVVMISPL